jgi:hypothetical protein
MEGTLGRAERCCRQLVRRAGAGSYQNFRSKFFMLQRCCRQLEQVRIKIFVPNFACCKDVADNWSRFVLLFLCVHVVLRVNASCMHLCTCMCACAFMHMYVCVWLFVNASCMHLCTCICACAFMHMYVCVWLFAVVFAGAQMCIMYACN